MTSTVKSTVLAAAILLGVSTPLLALSPNTANGPTQSVAQQIGAVLTSERVIPADRDTSAATELPYDSRVDAAGVSGMP